MTAYDRYLAGDLQDYAVTQEEVNKNIEADKLD
jgi:hypothetical protein